MIKRSFLGALLALPLACSGGSGSGGTTTTAPPPPPTTPPPTVSEPRAPEPIPNVTLGTCTVDASPRFAAKLGKSRLIGDEVGEMQGGFGFGRRGFGPGGGGTGWGTIGTGRYGVLTTIGHRITMGKPTITGSLDKVIIKRSIRRAYSKLRVCYDKALAKTPKLAGRLTLSFTINTSGRVKRAQSSGLNKAMRTCANQVAAALRFPKPKKGTVNVTYPLIFKRAVTPSVRIGKASATGGLDKAIIRRYIRRKRRHIKYCYEKQLLVRSGLKGTVVARFTIAASGTVTSSKAAGVNAKVAQCVASVIKTIVFPKPKGGGLVQVRYPFTFRSKAGSSRANSISQGQGTGSGYGTGSGRGGIRGRRSITPQVILGMPVAVGGLQKNIIRRYVRRKRAHIKYCYEKYLLVRPNIKGKLVAQFIIGLDGKVSRSRAAGFDDAVTACVASVIKRTQFPKPRYSVAVVSYPFMFRPGLGRTRFAKGSHPAGSYGQSLGIERVMRGDRARVRAGLLTRANAIAACVDQARLRGMTRDRRLRMRMKIEVDGTVSEASATGPTQLRACLAAVAMKTRFESERRGRVETARVQLLAKAGRRAPSVNVLSGKITALGYDKSIARRFLRRKAYPKIRECYVEALGKTKSAAGPLDVRFVIRPNGQAAAAVAGGVAPHMSKCVPPIIRSIRFPKTRGGGMAQIEARMLLRADGLLPKWSGGKVRAVKPLPPAGNGLKAEEIAKVVRAARPKVEQCFQAALLTNPMLEGKVTARFSITPAGAVSNASANGVSPRVSACVAKVLTGLQFPKSVRMSNVTFPFTFKGNTRAGGKQCTATSPSLATPHLTAIRECYAKALGRNPTLAGRGRLRFVDGKRTYTGMGDAGFHSCVQSALGRGAAGKAKATRCELIFSNSINPATPRPGVTVGVRADQIVMGGKAIFATPKLVAAANVTVATKELRQVVAANLTGGLEPVHLRVDPDVDMKAVTRVMHALNQNGRSKFVFYEKVGSGWKLLTDYVPPIWPRDCFGNQALMLRLTSTRVQLFHSTTTAHNATRAKPTDLGEVSAALYKARNKWPNHKHVRIVVGGGQPYRVLTSAVREAIKQGYTEPHVIGMH